MTDQKRLAEQALEQGGGILRLTPTWVPRSFCRPGKRIKLHPDYQGKGYAYEAVRAYFDYLFQERGARRLYAYTEDDNLPSQRLCEKPGMRREGLFLEFVTFVNHPDGTPLYENTIQYAILKREWSAQ